MGQSRALNGFTQAQVDNALRAVSTGEVVYRVRFELLDIDNLKIRDILNVQDGEVRHVAEQLIKRTAHFTVREADLDLDDYDVQVLTDGALVYWRLGDTSGTIANDETANNFDGTYTNAPTLNATSLLAGVTQNGSVTLNGSTQYITRAHSASFNTSTLSVEVWIKTSQSGSYQIIAARDNETTNKSWQLRITNVNVVEFVLWFSGLAMLFTTTAVVTDGLPHHIVATYDGSYATVYIDSYRVLRTSETRTLDSATVALEVGRLLVSGAFFNGSIDEFALYGYALSSAQVRSHYQKGVGDLSEIDYLRDRIKVWVGVKMEANGTDGTPWVEWPVIVAVLANPRRMGTNTGTERDVQGFDQSVILINDRVSTRYTVQGTTNYITAVSTLLTGAGFTAASLSLTATTLTLPTTREWITGTSKMDIINDLLSAANYRPLYFNGAGQAVAEPFVLPASRASEVTYEANSTSMLLPEIEVSTNLFEIPNKVIYARTNPKAGNLSSTQTNTSMSSPTSTIRTGRVNTFFDGNIDAADQTTLDGLAKRKLTEMSQVYQTVKIKTWLTPYHEDMDKVTLIDSTMNLSADFIEYGWTLPLIEIGDMDHELRFVVSVV